MSTISTTVSMSVSGGALTASLSGSANAEQSSEEHVSQTQTIGTTAEALDLGDLANVNGGICIRNNDAVNFVEIDAANTFNSFPQKIPAGQVAMLRPQTTTIYAKANTAAVVISVLAAKG